LGRGENFTKKPPPYGDKSGCHGVCLRTSLPKDLGPKRVTIIIKGLGLDAMQGVIVLPEGHRKGTCKVEIKYRNQPKNGTKTRIRERKPYEKQHLTSKVRNQTIHGGKKDC